MMQRTEHASNVLGQRIRERYHDTRKHLWQVQQNNWKTFKRQPLAEISGSFGDLGTLLPLMIALTESESIDLASTLVFSGLANICTGMAFGIPLPVQPMKAIAAVVIAGRLSPAVNISAGIFVAIVVGFLSLTGLMERFTNNIPLPVVRGIQMGTGLSLIISAGKLPDHDLRTILLLCAVFLGLLVSMMCQKLPYALVLLVLGIIGMIFDQITSSCIGCARWPHTALWHPRPLTPKPQEFSKGILTAGLGQVPLTTLNSVIAVTVLAADLFPNMPTPSTTSIGISVMSMNLVSCWFGAMPVCHGSGGLAAQYSFGARSGSSVIFLGLVKLFLGLFAENIAYWVFKGFPQAILCIMMIAAGLELAKIGSSLALTKADSFDSLSDTSTGYAIAAQTTSLVDADHAQRQYTVMFMTVAGIVAFKNDAIGFGAGMLCHYSCNVQRNWVHYRRQRQGRIRLDDD